jgi:hypothetical protein
LLPKQNLSSNNIIPFSLKCKIFLDFYKMAVLDHFHLFILFAEFNLRIVRS